MSKTNLTRRSFVKVSALAGAAAAVGASMAGCMQEAAPEEELAGTGEVGVSSTEGLTKMRTSCHGCIQMCPAIAYLKDGVVVRLEGDPEAPVSRGSLCIKGLNQLHTMYSRCVVPASAERTSGRSSPGTRPSPRPRPISRTPSTSTATTPSSPAWAAADPTRSWRP